MISSLLEGNLNFSFCIYTFVINFNMIEILPKSPGELYLKLDIILVKNFKNIKKKIKNHVIRVVFQDQAMYTCTSLGGKNVQNWKTVCVLGHIDKFWKGHNEIKKNAYLRSISIHQKYVFRVCFESPFTSMISSLKYKYPPGQKECSKILSNAL